MIFICYQKKKKKGFQVWESNHLPLDFNFQAQHNSTDGYKTINCQYTNEATIRRARKKKDYNVAFLEMKLLIDI